MGDKIASLVSLSLTPLKINKIKAIHPEIDRVDVEAQAILFESGLYAKLPDDMSEELALAALEATLLDWRDGRAVPVSAMLSAPPEELRRRAEALAGALSPLHPCTAVETQGEVGGGARPGESLPAWAAALEPAEALEAHLRAWRVPILGRIHRGKLLLDVRTPEEYRDGHLPGAKNLPLDRLDTIAEPAGSPLFVYCRSGARSAQAKARLARAGYSVTDLGGLLGYRGPLEA